MAQEMADQVECLCSLISLLMHIFHVLRKAISMALCSNPSTHSPSLPPLPWKRISDTPVSARKRSKEASDGTILSSDDASFFLASEGEELAVNHPILDSPPRDSCSEFDILMKKEHMLEDIDIRKGREHLMVGMVRSESLPTGTVRGRKAFPKLRKRPSMIVIPPEPWPGLGFSEEGMGKESMEKELEVEGSDYCLASRKGSRHVLEDGYKSITNIHGDPKQAFFGVFDGHGGRAAVDFVSEKLGTNIIEAMSQMNKEDQLEPAIRAGYLTTDTEFLNLGVGSGACAATVLLRNGEMHVSNVGDCRVVISRRGEATALTRDHSARREDERIRIENSGGYVTCHNGIWRVQDTLAVSRSIGDVSLKQWVISEPETTKVGLTPDCEFLIMASDGLWNKVSNQEAADVVSRNKNSMKSCKELVELSSLRGSRDDITVMVVGLQRFAKLVG